jgi:hypothetical protein
MVVHMDDLHAHRIDFVRGNPVAIRLAYDVAPLPKLLMQWDDIDMDRIDEVAATSASSEALRRRLLEEELVSPSRLAEVERQRALEELAHLFDLPPSAIELEAIEPAADEDAGNHRVVAHASHALLHYSRGASDSPVVRDYVGRLEDKWLALSPELDIGGLGLDPVEADVVWRLAEEPQTPRAMVAAGVDADVVRRIVFALSVCGGIVCVPPRHAKTARPGPSTPAPSTPAPSTPAPSTPAPSTPAPIASTSSAPPPRRQRITPTSAFAQAERELEHQNYRLALVATDQALELLVDDPSLLAMQAYAAAMLDWSAQTLAPEDVRQLPQLDALIERAPSCALAFCYRGLILRRLGLREAAIADLQSAAALNPYHSETHAALRELTEPPDEPAQKRAGGWRRWLRLGR